MRFSITGGRDVTGSAERAPLRPTLFDRLAVGVITVANSNSDAPPPPGASEQPEARTSSLAFSGAYSPWQVHRPHLEPMARRASV